MNPNDLKHYGMRGYAGYTSIIGGELNEAIKRKIHNLQLKLNCERDKFKRKSLEKQIQKLEQGGVC